MKVHTRLVSDDTVRTVYNSEIKSSIWEVC